MRTGVPGWESREDGGCLDENSASPPPEDSLGPQR